MQQITLDKTTGPIVKQACGLAQPQFRHLRRIFLTDGREIVREFRQKSMMMNGVSE
jgi:hypothetical protein